MLGSLKFFLHRLLPEIFFVIYHRFLSFLGAFLYGYPSRFLFVIGVTGTNGKSTTVNLIADILTEAGYKVAATSTVNFRVGDHEWLNSLKMTMPGRFYLQKFLRRAVSEGCQYAVIETSSEGIKQYRHLGIEYDAIVFTNLTPEHIESHGSFQNYKKAKEQLFIHTAQSKRKVLDGLRIMKHGVYNGNDQHVSDFFRHRFDEQWIFFVESKKIYVTDVAQEYMVMAKNVRVTKDGISFDCLDQHFSLKLLGFFNVYNALATLTVGRALDISSSVMKQALENVSVIPGRMESIDEGQPFRVLIDYAPEPTSMSLLYESLKNFSYQRLIHVLGSAGGGRDRARRVVLGRMSGTKADIVVVTNEDPYDDDPRFIMEQVARGAEEEGKVRDKNLFLILDRREAIAFALKKAQPSDMVVITGKGSEQAIVGPKGVKFPWDDREVVRAELQKLR